MNGLKKFWIGIAEFCIMLFITSCFLLAIIILPQKCNKNPVSHNIQIIKDTTSIIKI